MIPLLQELLEEFQEKVASFNGNTARHLHFPDIPNKIKATIGMRRN